jgi:FG-GAP-like repeat
VAEADEVVPLATTTRAFGRQPYLDTVAAAASSAAPWRAAGCGLSDAKLAAIVLSITFTEAGPLDSATVAPSPMTLSRWDGSAILYAFGDPATTFRNAFWHPGIGLWQFDHPWENTAAERIDTTSAAPLAAEVVSGRFCRWTAATGLSRFAYSVAPWHGCDDPRGEGERCREIFLNHYRDNDPGRLDDDTLTNFSLVDHVSALGGASQRTCQLVGATATVPCLFVDPATAEGSRAWTSPSFSPNPLSAPFYVLRDGDVERRFWLRDDTGYGTDIEASAAIGSNPRSTLQWSSGPRLCDRTVRKGACDLRPPSWKDWTVLQVSGTYEPFTGDFDGDGRADVFWYAPGTAPDSIWFGESRGGFTRSARAVDGSYAPLVGDFDGNGRADVFWYAPGSPAGSPDRIWRWTASGSVVVSDMPISGSYEPLVGDFDGDARDDVFLYGAGSYPDHVWYGTASGVFDKRTRPVSGTYGPLVGDFDGDAVDDLFWYASGSPPDSVWYGTASRGFQAVARPVSGAYEPVVGDISGNGTTDIVWYAPGVAADSVWRGTASRTFLSDPALINGTYVPLVADIDGAPGDDVFWYGAGSPYDALWFN